MSDHTAKERLENSKSTVLVVEDDAELLEFIASGLEENGFNVQRASDGQEGFEKALDHLPDLVLTDIMMPVMDGIALCNELKSNMMTSHIPVIMLTAKNTVESQIEGLETGADDYVTKPFHMTLLEARIRNILNTRDVFRKKFQQEFLHIKRAVPEHQDERGFLEQAYQVVEQRCSNPDFRPEDFAEALKLGMRYLQRKLKSVADSTPMKFITEVRMAEAAKLLAGSEMTITEIAYEVGCEDSSNFAKLFKQHFDIAPSEYRSKYR
jgi:CheY-like chemotaxis protein